MKDLLTVIGFITVVFVAGRAIAYVLVKFWKLSRHCNNQYMFHCWHQDKEITLPRESSCQDPDTTGKLRVKLHCCRCKKIMLRKPFRY